LESEALAPCPAAAVAATVRPAPGWWEAVGWALVHFVVAQFIPFLILVFWAVISGGGSETIEEMVTANFLPAILCGQLLGVGLSVLALRARVGRDWMSAIYLRRPALVPCLLAVLSLPLFFLVAGGAVALVEHLLNLGEPSRQLIMDGHAQHGLWFSLLVIAVGAAVNEELFCRGFLGRGLVGRHGVLVGVLCTSVIFALLHGNIVQGFFAFLLGCYVHLVYLKTRSLWVPILLHFLNNAHAVIVLTLLGEEGDTFEPAWNDPAFWVGLAIGVAVLAVSIVSAWRLYRLRDPQVSVAPVA
jgi:membrane protease YdiL (CAAX protease family)